MDQNMKKPEVTVLMPVYNGEIYLKDAINSILSQSYTDFELLIIDDGSTDKSVEIIKSYKDSRIVLFLNNKNCGLAHSLNFGINNSKGKYIARMDCDDISIPTRLEKQVRFMDNNPEFGICGTWIKTIGEISNYTNKYLENSDEIKANLLFNTSFAHPSVMIRKSVLTENNLKYNEDHKFYYEDYGLWVELSRVTKMTNIPEVLLRYRVYKKSFSRAYTAENVLGAKHLRNAQLKVLGLYPSSEEIILHNSLRYLDSNINDVYEFLKRESIWLNKIVEANKNLLIYSEKSLEKIIYNRWKTICGFNASTGILVWKSFINSPIFKFGNNKRYFDNLKIIIKCLLMR
jgi:glycosyltransferase involved in cell wall biosynthesis